MNCEHIQSDLQDYLEDSLSPGEKADVEGHIRACKTCQMHFEAARRLERALQGQTLSVPPAGFTTLIVASAARQRTTKSNGATAAIVAYVASVFLLAGGVSATLGYQELRGMIGALRGVGEAFLSAALTIPIVTRQVLHATKSLAISPLGLVLVLLALVMLTSTLLLTQLTINSRRL